MTLKSGCKIIHCVVSFMFMETRIICRLFWGNIEGATWIRHQPKSQEPKLGTSRICILSFLCKLSSWLLFQNSFFRIWSQLELKSQLEIRSQLEFWKPKKGANQSKIRFSILNISNQSNFEPLKIGILILICIKFYQVFLLCCYQVVFRSYRQSKFTNKVTMLTPKKGANQNQNRWSQLERLFEQFRPFLNIVQHGAPQKPGDQLLWFGA